MVFQEYFLDPILANGYFNPINTAVYAILLVVAVYIVYRVITKLNIPIDKHFFYAILPFVVWGSSTRVLHDAAFVGVLPSGVQEFYSAPFFPTPGSYLITFVLAFSVFLLSIGIMKVGKIPYWKPMAAIGSLLVLVNFVITPWRFFEPLWLVLGLLVVSVGIFNGIARLLRQPSVARLHPELPRILTPVNQGILAAHFLDASATFVSLSFFGYFEQHVVPNILIPFVGPVAMFLLKIVVVIPVVWVIGKYAENANFRNFLLIVVFILGFAPGMRDLLRLIAGV
ncbi:MAG: DUF63 family protein [Nanoarchaeota archaeon]|nr:DUF63 family protein [Nanoarchaeota archaeon]